MNFEKFNRIKEAVLHHYQLIVPMTLVSSLLLVGYAALDKEAPVINTDMIAMNYGEEFDSGKIQIEDNQTSLEDLTITYDTSKLDVNTVGTSYVTVTATDLSNNTTTKTIEVNVVDNEKPVYSVADTVNCKMENGVLVINLNSSNLITDYIKATDNADGDVTAFIDQSAPLDTSVPGKYAMAVSVTDSSGNINSKELDIEVKDITGPTLTYVYGAAVEIPYGEAFDLSKYITAVDNSGEIKVFATTEPVDTTREDYIYTVVAEDVNGNATGCNLEVITKDISGPSINVQDTYNVTQGQSFDINSYLSVIDNKDGDLTSSATVSGSVNTAVSGNYTITITATDSCGNTSTKVVTVVVSPSYAGIVNVAKSKLGSAYVTGGTGPNAFDCSGFVQWVYAQNGKSIPRSTYTQYAACTKVSYANMQPGDLIFWNCHNTPNSHVSIYVGGGMIIHAATPSSGVCYTSISNMLINATIYGIGRF